MHLEELRIKYGEVSGAKLCDMFDIAEGYSNKAEDLNKRHESIMQHIADAVSKKFKDIKIANDKLATAQLEELSKQWRLLSASAVMVKRSIALPGFHNTMNLYINSRYGVKEHKRYSGWSPFTFCNIESTLDREAPFEFKSDKLKILQQYTEGELDFIALQAIPQLDSNKVKLLTELTKDIVNLVNSWRSFYAGQDKNLMADIKLMETTERGYGIRHDEDNKQYYTCLRNLEKILAYKQRLAADLTAQAAQWAPVLEKWKEYNKNFLVLSELAKSDLRV